MKSVKSVKIYYLIKALARARAFCAKSDPISELCVLR